MNIYVLFSVTFGMTSPTMYYYTKVMSELFLDSQFPDTKNTFRGMTTKMDFWRVGNHAKSKLLNKVWNRCNVIKTCHRPVPRGGSGGSSEPPPHEQKGPTIFNTKKIGLSFLH